MDEVEPFLTSDTPLAAYLVMRGMHYIGTKRDDHANDRVLIILLDEPERSRYEQEFRDNVGGFWSFWVAFKSMNRHVKDEKYKSGDAT